MSRSFFSRREVLKLLALSPLLAVPANRNILRMPMKPNVLILVFDALSARHISLYGYPRDTMPNLARFAQSGVVFHEHYSPGSFTTSGTASLFTGQDPWTHRAFQPNGTILKTIAPKNLFAYFHNAGYHTLGFSHNLLVNILLHQIRTDLGEVIPPEVVSLMAAEYSDAIFSKDYGIAVQAELGFLKPVGQLPNSLFLALFTRTLEQRESRSFSRQLRDQFPRGLPQNHDLLYTLEDFVDWWLTTQPTLPEPWMSYLHVMPPHDPYYPRVDFIGRFAEQPVAVPNKPEHYFSEGRDQAFLEGKREQYDEFIAYADAEFGRLIDGMQASGTLENTIVVVTADHGEMFERGIYRHITPALYEPIVRIPLVMRVPGNNERVDIHSPSSSVDLLQTLGHLIDAGLPGWGAGQLLPPWNGSPGNRSLYMMDAKSNSKFGPLVKGTFAMRLENYKVINYIGYDGFDDITEVYDLENDPEELANLWGKGSFGTDLLSILKAEIDAHSRPIEN